MDKPPQVGFVCNTPREWGQCHGKLGSRLVLSVGSGSVLCFLAFLGFLEEEGWRQEVKTRLRWQ